LPDLGRALRLAEQLQETIGEAARVVRLEEDAAAGLFQDLREGAVPRRDDRRAAGHRLEQVKPLGLRVRAGHAEDVHVLQESDLARAVGSAVVAELVGEAPLDQVRLDAAQVTAVVRGEVSGRLETSRREPALPPEHAVGLGELMETLLGRDAGEVADDRHLARRAGDGTVPVEVDPERDVVDAVAGEAEIARHVVGVVPARRDEGVDRRRVLPDEGEALRPPGLAQPVQEEVVSLQRAADWTAERPLERRGQAEQHRHRDDHDVEGRLRLEVLHELAQLLGLIALFAA
jgi:hypothetical protein